TTAHGPLIARLAASRRAGWLAGGCHFGRAMFLTLDTLDRDSLAAQARRYSQWSASSDPV
ncbi:hypothetical protein, partial [Ferrimicrobium acidiphilum]|uniref:hypothetical protein n=1 Tax=Ferrimicrobium acidiphilum TaxID=121039 RepID=UPI0023F5671B